MKALIACTLAFASLFASAQTQPPSITTKGVAHVYAIPDEVVIDVYIKNEGDNLIDPSELSDKQAREVLKLCKDFDIKPEHAQSRYRRYGKNWRYKDGHPKFEASQTINICLKDLSRYDDFMKALIAVEIHSVSGATFRTTKHREHMDAARVKAVHAAKEKAELLAGVLDQTIGRAMDIQESNVSQRWGGTSAYANTSESRGDSIESDGSAFAPGQLKIEAEVQVTFALN